MHIYTYPVVPSKSAQENFVHQDPGERNSDHTGDCPGLACGCLGWVQESPAKMWVSGGLLQAWGHRL